METSTRDGRTRLLDSAERLFAERGVDGPSLRDINTAAGQRNASGVQYHFGGRAGLLADARVCVIPRPINPYSNLAMPIKLWDYLSLGKPIVATAATETAGILAASGAGIATPDTPEGLAGGLLQVLADAGLARRLAANARTFAMSTEATWDARALTVLRTLDVAEAAGPGPSRANG